MGSNIPEFKRRFFVLKASTHLYYFLGPGDIEPRGCIDLENANVELIETLQDGRSRFCITLVDNRRVILEARNEDVGKEWIASLQDEQLTRSKERVGLLEQENARYQNQISLLEKQLEEFRLIEKDRDGALEDALNWKQSFLEINEAIRLLTQFLRRPPLEEEVDTREGDEQERKDTEKTCGGDETTKAAEPPPPTSQNADAGASAPDNPNGDDATNASTTQRETSLLDIAIESEAKDITELDVPGTHFSALSNVCQQLRENMRLASIEASSAVEDVTTANQRSAVVEKKLEKTEKHLCKLWEENTAIRQELNITKQEKRVLIKEVKTLRAKASHPVMPQDRPAEEDAIQEATVQSDKILEEMEDHILTGLRAHEKLMASTQKTRPPRAVGGADHTNDSGGEPSTEQQRYVDLGHVDDSIVESVSEQSSKPSNNDSPLRPKVLSLFDGESDSDDDGCSVNSYDALISSQFDADEGDDQPPPTDPTADLEDEAPNMCAASTQSESTQSVVTDNGHATSRLVCPLADVVETASASGGSPGAVYHISFHSKKLGLQFLKVPSSSANPGALTPAITADLLAGNDADSEKTASELRAIAEMAQIAKGTQHIGSMDDTCQVATPIDAVLVCGFNGFASATHHRKPTLGARLVAIDGRSVEVGQWTYTSIRKAIAAHGRPLTLSFRDDYLATEQRAMLTKAIAEDNVTKSSRDMMHHGLLRKVPDSIPASSSSMSESDALGHRRLSDYDDDLSVSVSSTHCEKSYPAHGGGETFRSFSDAGSSSVFSTSLGPLMATLMSGLTEKSVATPDYLNNVGESVESAPLHHDYQSGLL